MGQVRFRVEIERVNFWNVFSEKGTLDSEGTCVTNKHGDVP